jgi:hypothetical protein
MSEALAAVLEQARHLSPLEKVQLVESLLPEVKDALGTRHEGSRRVWRGIYEGKGPVPSAEDIQEMRREAWPES